MSSWDTGSSGEILPLKLRKAVMSWAFKGASPLYETLGSFELLMLGHEIPAARELCRLMK